MNEHNGTIEITGSRQDLHVKLNGVDITGILTKVEFEATPDDVRISLRVLPSHVLISQEDAYVEVSRYEIE